MSSPEYSFESVFQQFLQQGSFNFVAKDSTGKNNIMEAVRLLRLYTELYLQKNRLLPSVSAFKIIANELRAEHLIVPMKKEEAEEEITLTAEQYHRIPTATLQFRYKQDPQFREACDRLHATGQV